MAEWNDWLNTVIACLNNCFNEWMNEQVNSYISEQLEKWMKMITVLNNNALMKKFHHGLEIKSVPYKQATFTLTNLAILLLRRIVDA